MITKQCGPEHQSSTPIRLLPHPILKQPQVRIKSKSPVARVPRDLGQQSDCNEMGS
jgi:hypothetical protein